MMIETGPGTARVDITGVIKLASLRAAKTPASSFVIIDKLALGMKHLLPSLKKRSDQQRTLQVFLTRQCFFWCLTPRQGLISPQCNKQHFISF